MNSQWFVRIHIGFKIKTCFSAAGTEKGVFMYNVARVFIWGMSFLRTPYAVLTRCILLDYWLSDFVYLSKLQASSPAGKENHGDQVFGFYLSKATWAVMISR